MKKLCDEMQRVQTTTLPDPMSQTGQGIRLSELLKRPDESYDSVIAIDHGRPN